MNRVRSRLFGGRQDAVGDQIRLRAGCRPDVNRLHRIPHVQRIAIRVRIHSHGLDTHFMGGPNYANRDFTAVRY
jgi:hypothetical protein